MKVGGFIRSSEPILSAVSCARTAARTDVSNDEASARKGVMMRQPTLFLTVGLPGTGKTTAARRIEIEQRALRLTKDEWVKALYGHENPPSAHDVIEGRLVEIGLRALELGNNVVIDFGLWSRDERSALRQAAADRGAMVEMRYFDLTQPSSGDDWTSAKPKRRTRRGPCLTRNSPNGPPTSTSQPQVNSTVVNRSMTHRLDSRHGTGGAVLAGRRRSPDDYSSPPRPRVGRIRVFRTRNFME